MGLGLTFRTLIYLGFIFVHDIRKCSSFISLYVAVQISQNHLLKRLFFSLAYSCLLCHRLIEHRCVGLHLSILLYSMMYVSCFVPMPFYFDYCSFAVQFEIRQHDTSSFVLHVQDYFVYSGSFVVHTNFRNNLFYFCEKCYGSFGRDCIKSVVYFVQHINFNIINSSNRRTQHTSPFLFIVQLLSHV